MHDSHEDGYRYARPQACIDELRAALEAMFDLVGGGDFVRNIENDSDTSKFAMQGLRIVGALNLTRTALERTK